MEKLDGCTSNLKNSFITKVGKQIPSGFSISTISSLKKIENKYDVYRSKDAMKKFCKLFREHVMKIVNFKKKKVKLLTKGQLESYEKAKICYICKKN